MLASDLISCVGLNHFLRNNCLEEKGREVTHLLQQEKVAATTLLESAAAVVETTKPNEGKELFVSCSSLLEIISQTSILYQQVVPKWHIVARGKIFIVMYLE